VTEVEAIVQLTETIQSLKAFLHLQCAALILMWLFSK
jgi:hypothetical protein